jgi:nitrous oxidase accessory protein NosD
MVFFAGMADCSLIKICIRPYPIQRSIRNNIISGNNSGGLLIFDSPGATIQSNLIGTDASGTQDFGNGEEGIDIVNSPGAIIGGTAAGAGNIIAFN